MKENASAVRCHHRSSVCITFSGCDCRLGDFDSANGNADPVRTSNGVLPLTRDTTYRVGSVGPDCQLLLWDFVISDDDTRACMDQR